MSSALRLFALAACFALAGSAAAQQSRPAEAVKPAAAAKTGMAALADPSSMTEQAPELFKVSFFTTEGEFAVEVHRDWSPTGADRFYNLVKNGFYNDTGFFRVVPGFMVQFGLSGHPSVSRALKTATIQDDPVKKSNTRGYVSFAKTGAPNSRTTQVFINFGDNSRLDGMGFAPFAQVIGDGMTVVDAINSQYREQPSQGRIQSQGNDYLRGSFPELDFVLAAEIMD
jgi:peptidyl-prolyl cis-trans isomerase A (cyclophilin A)